MRLKKICGCSLVATIYKKIKIFNAKEGIIMKKLAKFLMLPIALCTALGFAACQDNTTSSSDASSSSDPIISSSSETSSESASASSSSSEASSESSSSSAEETYVAPTTVEGAVSAAKKYADKVATGEGTFTTKDSANADAYVVSINYGLIAGKYFEYATETAYSNTDYRYAIMEDGNVYGVRMELEEIYNDDWTEVIETKQVPTVIPETKADNLSGYGFGIGDSLSAYGVENWISTLYAYAKAIPAANKTNVALSESVVDGKYSFAFDFATSIYYSVNVSFTLDDNGMLDSCSWDVSLWYYGQGKDDAGNWLMTEGEESVPAYNNWGSLQAAEFAWDTENEYWYLVSGENPWDSNETYAFIQSATGTVTDRATQYRVTSMSVKTAAGAALPKEMNMALGGDTLVLTMTDLLPTTAALTANNVEIVVDGENEYGLSAYQDWSDKTKINVNANSAGEYTVTIKLNGAKVASTTITVKKPLPTTLAVGVNSQYNDITTNGYLMYLGNSVKIVPILDNEYADGSVEITVKCGTTDCTGSVVTVVDGEITFTPNAATKYEITLESTVVDGLTATAYILVQNAPTYADILTGTYEVWGVDYDYDYNPTDVKIGTISFNDGKASITINVDTDYDDDREEYAAVYTYTITTTEDGESLEIELESGEGAVSFKVTEDYKLVVTYDYNYGTSWGEWLEDFETKK